MTSEQNFVLVPDDAPAPALVPAARPGLLARMGERAMAVFAAVSSSLRHAEPPEDTDTPTRPRLIFAVDATASREPAWSAARQVTDALVRTLPGELDVALAVHGGGRVHTFTEFTGNAAVLRDRAAGVTCQPGLTRLLPIIAASVKRSGVRVVIYIGDVFEESLPRGRAIADAMAAAGTKLIVLHDTADRAAGRDAEIFWDLARRTGGCVLPFDAGAPARLRDLLSAVAVYATGGEALLRARRETMPGAVALLEHLSGRR